MKDLVKKQVDEVVAAIDGGKKAENFADAAKKDPYMFVMEMGENCWFIPHLQDKA